MLPAAYKEGSDHVIVAAPVKNENQVCHRALQRPDMSAIEAIKARHESVRQLVDNYWLHRFRMEGETTEHFQNDQWHAWEQERRDRIHSLLAHSQAIF